MLKRDIENTIEEYLTQTDHHKILFIWGPRRSGKTTILKNLSKELNTPIFNFDTESDKAKYKTTTKNIPTKSASQPTIHNTNLIQPH